MVDEERLRRVLQRVSEDLDGLERHATDAAGVRADRTKLDAVKYRFVTVIEGCIDAAHHVCASEGWGPPDSNADAIRVLGRHGVLTDDLTASVAAAAGFRNLLVHGYAEVDDDRVVEFLGRLPDLRAYVAAVAALAA